MFLGSHHFCSNLFLQYIFPNFEIISMGKREWCKKIGVIIKLWKLIEKYSKYYLK